MSCSPCSAFDPDPCGFDQAVGYPKISMSYIGLPTIHSITSTADNLITIAFQSLKRSPVLPGAPCAEDQNLSQSQCPFQSAPHLLSFKAKATNALFFWILQRGQQSPVAAHAETAPASGIQWKSLGFTSRKMASPRPLKTADQPCQLPLEEKTLSKPDRQNMPDTWGLSHVVWVTIGYPKHWMVNTQIDLSLWSPRFLINFDSHPFNGEKEWNHQHHQPDWNQIVILPVSGFPLEWAIP